MIKSFERKIPDGKIGKPEPHDGQSHHASRGERRAERAVQAAFGGGCGAAVGGGRDLHAQKSRKSRKESARQKGKGQEFPDKARQGENAQHREHTSKKYGNHEVLPFEKGVRAFANDRGDPVRVGIFAHAQDFARKKQRKAEREHRRAGRDQNRIFH